MTDTIRPTRVLVVDDDRLVHEILGILLDRTAFSLSSAKNVAEAMESIAADMPDIIITDAMMPGESGFSLIEKVKTQAHTQHIPIILMTILEEPDGSVMDASGKADFSVNKPIYSSNIVSSVEKARHLVEQRKISTVMAASPSAATRLGI